MIDVKDSIRKSSIHALYRPLVDRVNYRVRRAVADAAEIRVASHCWTSRSTDWVERLLLEERA